MSAFNRLLDTIVDSKVDEIPQLEIDIIKEKLDTWLQQAESELLKYKLAYAQQALLGSIIDGVNITLTQKAVVRNQRMQKTACC